MVKFIFSFLGLTFIFRKAISERCLISKLKLLYKENARSNSLWTETDTKSQVKLGGKKEYPSLMLGHQVAEEA